MSAEIHCNFDEFIYISTDNHYISSNFNGLLQKIPISTICFYHFYQFHRFKQISQHSKLLFFCLVLRQDIF